MQRFKKLGVFLHDSPADDAALDHVSSLAVLAQSESLLCVHVHETDYEGQQIDASTFQANVRRKLPAAVANITTFELCPGAGVPEILRAARDTELDLIIVGRRLPSEQVGIGSAFARLARKAPCSVLVVPKHSRPHFGRVVVPVDFSDHARLALEQGLAIALASGDAHPQLIVLSNFTVGYGYAKLGLTLAQAVAEREQTVKQQLQEFVANLDLRGVALELVCTSSQLPEVAIQEVAVARKMDLIVVGSRGTGSVFMLGSTAERILLESVLPVLVFKRKGETTHILDALFGSG